MGTISQKIFRKSCCMLKSAISDHCKRENHFMDLDGAKIIIILKLFVHLRAVRKQELFLSWTFSSLHTHTAVYAQIWRRGGGSVLLKDTAIFESVGCTNWTVEWNIKEEMGKCSNVSIYENKMQNGCATNYGYKNIYILYEALIWNCLFTIIVKRIIMKFLQWHFLFASPVVNL